MSGLIWVTWRQQRALVVTAGAAIVVFGLSAALEHGHVWNMGASMTRTLAAFLPIALGLLWGVPLLARPLEDHTADLVWTQTVPRVRWLASALALVVTVTVVVSLAMLAILPTVLTSKFGILYTYSVESAGAVGYTLFALALGVFCGALIGRVEPAMAVTLVVYAAVRLKLDSLRAHLIPLQHVTLTNKQAVHFADNSIYLVSQRNRQYDVVFTYQTAQRMATIQWIELGIYAAMAAVLLAGTFAVVTRRGAHR